MARFLTFSLLCVLALCLASTPFWSVGSVDSEESEQRKFTLVFNVNNGGYIDVCGCKHKEVRQGSLTRRASFLRQFRATGRELLLVDAGSAFFAIGKRMKKEERAEAIRKAELIVESYNRMGYQAMSVGPFDLAAGVEVTKDLEKRAKFPFLSANLYDKNTGKRFFKPHTVINVGGVRVGLIGLTLSSMSRPFLAKVGSHVQARDPMKSLRTSIDELKKDENAVDLVFVLAHTKEETNFKIAETFPDIHVLVDPYIQYGSHHTWIKDHEWVQRRAETVFLRGDGQGARLGLLDIEVFDANKPLVSTSDLYDLEDKIEADEATSEDRTLLTKFQSFNPFDFTRLSLEPHHLTDPGIDQLVEQWKKNIDLAGVAELEDQLPRKKDYLTVTGCQKCHEKQHDWWLKTKHAHALASLERTGDHQRFDCIGCHTLGYGEAFLNTTKVGQFANVQCESCHGTNPQHAQDPKKHTYRKITKQQCLQCHNKEQTLKDFRFSQARKQVACPKS